jgi:hypothetical protein
LLPTVNRTNKNKFFWVILSPVGEWGAMQFVNIFSLAGSFKAQQHWHYFILYRTLSLDSKVFSGCQ